MAVQQPHRVGVAADLRVLVPRDAAGDLPAGVATVVGRVDAVDDVAGVDVVGLTPRLNDLRVEARVEATVAVDPPDEETVGAALAEGFGVEVVDLSVERP